MADLVRDAARVPAAGRRACVRSIVIADALFDDYPPRQRLHPAPRLPGGVLPSRAAFVPNGRAAPTWVVNELAFGGDYARTLALWSAALKAKLPQVRALGHDERFIRLWRFTSPIAKPPSRRRDRCHPVHAAR